MIWQDIILTFGGFALTLFLLPLLKKNVPPLPYISSVPVTLVLWSYVPAVATLGLALSAVTLALQASVWTAVVVKKARPCWFGAHEAVDRLIFKDPKLPASVEMYCFNCRKPLGWGF